jgi:hypothetical protein
MILQRVGLEESWKKGGRPLNLRRGRGVITVRRTNEETPA